MKAKWTETIDEVKKFEKKNKSVKMITEYFEDNRKKFSFFCNEKDKEPVAIFEQYFDMNFFK